MRSRVFKLLNGLKVNTTNTISFYRNNNRYEKTFSEFSSDVDKALSRLNYLKRTFGTANVALLGPISYDWIVCDMACIKGGFLSIAIPETLPSDKVISILEDTKADIVLMDCCFADKFNIIGCKTYHFECKNIELETGFWKLQEFNNISLENLILEEFSIVFSSGTSEKIKHIKRTFPDLEKKKETLIDQIKKIGLFIKYKRSFWSRKDNKLIIFMPFSHPQQRDFFRIALIRKINIVLSDQKNCIKHIILEKPNLMIAVPVVYEAIASRIKAKIGKFSPTQNAFFSLFNTLSINSLSNNNYIKRIFSFFLFKDIKKIYGGKADYFITGSAPISAEVIKIFYSVGVKLLQAYGQSETGTIAMNTPESFKIGSVGKPIMEVEISKESEILVKYSKEWHSSNKDVLTIDNNEFIHTGDLGYLDKDGFLFITGRKDDIIVLENGKKVFPEKIESIIKGLEAIKEVCIFIKEGYKLQAVLDCIGRPRDIVIREFIQSVNNKLPVYERISAFYISETAFSEENGLLTATFKKKRSSIKKLFAEKEFIAV